MNLRFWESFTEDEGIKLSAACISDKGKRRSENEDNFYFDGEYLNAESMGTDRCLTLKKAADNYTLLVVFDGMGGGDYGEVASYEAAVTASEFMNSGKINPVDITPSLTLLCEEMNRRVFEQGQNLGAYQMGSTVAAIFLYSGQFWVCNIGDSRVYGLRGDSFAQLSVDHTDEELMREQGITNRKPYLTQFLGLDPNETRIVPYIKSYRFDSDDRFLICSDGVTDMIPFHEIEAIIKNERTPKEAVDRLVKLALKNGGKDNITAIICDIVNG